MNRRPLGLLTPQVVTGFLQYKTAEALSPNTLISYESVLNLWLAHIGAVDLGSITSATLLEFLAWLRTDYKPRRITGDAAPLSAKYIRNVYAVLSVFFRWAQAEFDLPNPMVKVPTPRFQKPPVEPFKKEEIEALLKACEYTQEASTDQRKKFMMKRVTARRDRAILLTLLDTGLRASELCALRIGDVDQKAGRVEIRHGIQGGAKGGKGRVVFLGKVTRSALWRYLTERADATDPLAPLFLSKINRPLNKNALRQLINALGQKAHVKKSYPHRLRHTFAITYLRSGGDVFTLQALLGHSTLQMVQHYTRVAEIDLEQAHRRASPADNWHL
jgi:integrase/recombinase XerD